jgi:copper resistance protein C
MTGWEVMQKIINALMIGLLGGLLVVGTAYAHAAYLRSIPGADAIIATPPSRVDIWFEQELFRRQGENTIQVTGPDGTVVSDGETMIDDDDRKHIWVNIQPGLSAGKYLVEWKNVSLEDGHSSIGSFSFMMDPQAKVTSTPMGSVTQTCSPHPPQIDSTPQPPPTTESSHSKIPSPTNNPCTMGFIPLIGLVMISRMLRFQRR